MISSILYAAYLALCGVNPNVIPEECHTIQWNRQIIENSQWITGYHNYNEHAQALHDLYEILDCENKSSISRTTLLFYSKAHHGESSPKYTQRANNIEKKINRISLQDWQCPEIVAHLSNAPQQSLSLTYTKELSNKLQCERHHKHSNHHHTNQTQEN